MPTVEYKFIINKLEHLLKELRFFCRFRQENLAKLVFANLLLLERH